MRLSDKANSSAQLPIAWLAGGLVAGLIYGVADTVMDLSLLPNGGSLLFEVVHRFFNMITPPMAGMAVGVLFAYMRQRDARVAAERRVSEALRERLKGAGRQQAVWLVASSLLHDVRNPLHALGLLIDEASEARTPEQARQALDRARTQADRIEHKIRSLREMAESPPRDRTRLDVAALVHSLASDLREVATRAQVALQVGQVPALRVEADERYVRTPLENLVMNAIRAASSSADPLVRIEVERTDRELQLKVFDNGPGIPEDIVQVLFEPLHASKNLGLGLGLPLARALARLEGGDVRLLSNGPPQTVVALSLPLPTEGPSLAQSSKKLA